MQESGKIIREQLASRNKLSYSGPAETQPQLWRGGWQVLSGDIFKEPSGDRERPYPDKVEKEKGTFSKAQADPTMESSIQLTAYEYLENNILNTTSHLDT